MSSGGNTVSSAKTATTSGSRRNSTSTRRRRKELSQNFFPRLPRHRQRHQVVLEPQPPLVVDLHLVELLTGPDTNLAIHVQFGSVITQIQSLQNGPLHERRAGIKMNPARLTSAITQTLTAVLASSPATVRRCLLPIQRLAPEARTKTR